jgi:hypothetical protein
MTQLMVWDSWAMGNTGIMMVPLNKKRHRLTFPSSRSNKGEFDQERILKNCQGCFFSINLKGTNYHLWDVGSTGGWM